MTAELGDFIEAAGLLEYDPAAITRIYAGHPQRLIRRLWQTLVPIGLLLLGVAFDWIFQQLKDETRARARARECAELLVDLGPAFIKAGQALSTRPDIVPPLLLEELAQLQDQLPGFDSQLAMACIEEDLAHRWTKSMNSSTGSRFQPPPSGTRASWGQKVVMQRPGLREQITLDLYIVRNIAAWLNSNIGLIRSDLVALIDEPGAGCSKKWTISMSLQCGSFPGSAQPQPPHRCSSDLSQCHESCPDDGMDRWGEAFNLDAVRELGIDPDDMVEVGVNCSSSSCWNTASMPIPTPAISLPEGWPPQLPRLRT